MAWPGCPSAVLCAQCLTLRGTLIWLPRWEAISLRVTLCLMNWPFSVWRWRSWVQSAALMGKPHSMCLFIGIELSAHVVIFARGCLWRQYFLAWHSRYILDGFPKTLKQAELMESRSIIPMIVIELELDTVEVLKRGLVDKMKPNKSENAHN